ncbi:MAG: hypothetical protein IT436_01655 [Phycisphaerales bacterium]|nr:hypothetical protein [Phycisphaerales bacterium]
MHRSVNLNRSPLGKLLSLRNKLRLPKLNAGPKSFSSVRPGPGKPPGPPEPMVEHLNRSPEARFSQLL